VPSGSTGHRRGTQGSLLQSAVKESDRAECFHFTCCFCMQNGATAGAHDLRAFGYVATL